MSVEKAETATTSAERRVSFFRQSGWLMFASIAGGALTWLVHFLNKFIPSGAYGNFGALLALVILVPTFPLQMVLAQQTAKALAEGTERELSGIIRAGWLFTSLIWLAGAIIVFLLQGRILELFQMSSPIGLWATLVAVLFTLWLPMFWGVLQGQQNFLCLGWSMMSNAAGRIVVATFTVLVLRAAAEGMMVGVLVGTMLAFAIAAWQTRSLWKLPPRPFDRRSLAGQVFPLALAFVACQVLFTVDTLLVKIYFSKEDADFYVAAGTLSRALMWLVLPLAAVMFPRIVQSAAKSEKTDLVGFVLAATAALAILGALGLSLLGPLIVRLVYKPEFVSIASSVLPWYAFAMVPLALGNVLLNNLFASPTGKWPQAISIFCLAVAYIFALTRFNTTLVAMLKTMGVFNLAFLALCAWFTWGPKLRKA